MAIRLKSKHCVVYIFVVSIASFLIFSYFTYSRSSLVEEMRLERERNSLNQKLDIKRLPHAEIIESEGKTKEIKAQKTDDTHTKDHSDNKDNVLKFKGKKDSELSSDEKENTIETGNHQKLINYDVHVFYYPWYKTPGVDGAYAHWDHELLPHWTDKTADSKRRRKHTPPGDIGANFYPKLGPYSSKDSAIVDAHMSQIGKSGVGVVVVSWYPPHHEKDVETPVDSLMPLLLDAADKHHLKIAFHVEPYKDRSGSTLKEVMNYMLDKYGHHPAFYRTQFKGKDLPVVYIYDSYQIDSKEWAQALKPDGKHSVRGTEADAVFLGLLVERQHFGHLLASGFDGFYTYFASNGFSYGSSWKNWPFIAKEAAEKNLLFVPSIGPGYIDTRVRQWNVKNTKPRLHGQYYRASFDSAMKVKPRILSVTSFNEWHEGTQIEAAVPKRHEGYKYEDYWPESPEFYLDMTKQFVLEYHRNMTLDSSSHEHDAF